MALPSFEVAPVKKTSLTSRGISLRITAAVKVFPCTTRTLRFGCLFTNSMPPPFNASFYGYNLKKSIILRICHRLTTLPIEFRRKDFDFDYTVRKLALFKAARLMTLTPNRSALRMASSMWLFMPSAANGKKYCQMRTREASSSNKLKYLQRENIEDEWENLQIKIKYWRIRSKGIILSTKRNNGLILRPIWSYNELPGLKWHVSWHPTLSNYRTT